jgi:hypothetical protein
MKDVTGAVGNSDASGDSQSSSESQQSQVDLTALQKRLEELEAKYRGVQKGTDKVNARVESRVAEILSTSQIGRIAELAKAGKDSAEIERELLLEDLLAERKGKATDAQIGNERAAGMDEVTSIFKRTVQELGLDANNSAVAEAVSKKDHAALLRLAVSKSTVPDPDATTQPPITSKETPAKGGEEIERGYLAELAKIPRGKTQAVANLKAKWRKIARDKGFILNV